MLTQRTAKVMHKKGTNAPCHACRHELSPLRRAARGQHVIELRCGVLGGQLESTSQSGGSSGSALMSLPGVSSFRHDDGELAEQMSPLPSRIVAHALSGMFPPCELPIPDAGRHWASAI